MTSNGKVDISASLTAATQQYLAGNYANAEVEIKQALGALHVVMTGREVEIEYRRPDPSEGPAVFTRLASALWGLSPDDLGKTFTAQRRLFRIVGANLRATRMPIIAEDVRTGKRFKFAPASVKTGLDFAAKRGAQ